ncbi:MAG: phosphate ABC transporter permease PstA [Acidobacteriota bacterium]|nr:phosphate ABC transporter permease PstA [Acidobacteriota bacterium]
MAGTRDNARRGEPAIWLAGSGLGICLLLIAGMIALILTKGLGFFWPGPLEQLTLNDGSVVLGEVTAREPIPQPGTPAHLTRTRVQLKLGNRDLTGADFRWIDEDAISARALPPDVLYVERREYGPFLGRMTAISAGDRTIASGSAAVLPLLPSLVDRAANDRAQIRRLERDELGAVNARIEQQRLALRALDLDAQRGDTGTAARRAAIAERTSALERDYAALEQALMQVTDAASRVRVTLQAADGTEKELPALDLYRAYPANTLSTAGRARVYVSRVWEFLSGDPRESNTEGGIFPAIFGTVMMVVLMSVLAVPFGVLAALYLREYARQGIFVRAVRIAVNNLAGVPSIVFGVFGLGFFVYLVGGSIDAAFYPERLPSPTYGTGGMLWASLTLALLTVPVVIVASEEALAAVPRSMREASLASGATTFQTLTRVVLPAAAPGILTGLILAMARGAGEVAPLMITGVVKLAPDLPLDGEFPYLHLERKFMHLGFHIYDVGFQSPNVEAAKPMVYATSILLLVIVLLLNLTAIIVRSRLRRKYQSAAF